MLMPKKHRTLIYEYLMKEGVVVAEKDFGLDKHPAIQVPNIHVIKALQVCLINLSIRKFSLYF
jgi:small subunit ribosomal protein S10e